MKKKLIIPIALIVILVMVFTAGCGLISGTTESLLNSDDAGSSSGDSSGGSSGDSASSGTTTKIVTYTDVSRKDLEDALTKYQDIAEKLSARVDSLEQIVSDVIAKSGQNIGYYATTLVDSLLNLTCVESQYNLGCQGTGFIITADGYVITNNHVIAYEATVIDPDSIRNYGMFTHYGYKTVSGEYSSITATFDSESKYYANGSVYTLEFVYRDPAYDLALCKLKDATPVGDAWSAIPFYSGEVNRGDEILVLGNADGFGLSATSGLVSATGKTFQDYTKLTFIQTDAAINGGNSGGPAVNIHGALIGVVNSKFVSTNIENMGFAIELDKLIAFIDNAKAAKSISVNYTTKGAITETEESAQAA